MIGNPASVENLAEIGVILLLFIIGLEFSISHLLKNMASITGAGVLQMGLTIAAWYFIQTHYFGDSGSVSLALAMIIALSSTAIVLKMITDHAELDTLHGRTSVGILLFQDLCVVPLMLMIPLLAHSGETSGMDFAVAFGKAFAAVAGIFFLSRLLVPRFLSTVARMGSKEHLTLLVILIILGTGWVSHKLGLSLAMGAFIAGLIISESEYSHQIILDILPLRDYFSSIFFISIGMLLNIGYFMDHASVILYLTLVVIVLKTVSGFIASVAVGKSCTHILHRRSAAGTGRRVLPDSGWAGPDAGTTFIRQLPGISERSRIIYVDRAGADPGFFSGILFSFFQMGYGRNPGRTPRTTA